MKNEKVATVKERFQSEDLDFLCSQILMFVIGSCKPQSVESIDITKNANQFEAAVEWSENSNYEDTQGKVLNKTIVNDSKDIEKVAHKLRDEKKELFIVTITSYEQIICWFLE